MRWLGLNEPDIDGGTQREPWLFNRTRLNRAHLDHGWPQAVIVTMRDKED